MKTITKEIFNLKNKRKKLVFWDNFQGNKFYFLLEEVNLYGTTPCHAKSAVLEYNGKYYFLGCASTTLVAKQNLLNDNFINAWIENMKQNTLTLKVA